ncbi:hypothetical protein GXW82_07135 [Streptacidiphilus sp. 4-A2]|nr:hypothetical protein [Streptacidiphilus sp. 4-A2]
MGSATGLRPAPLLAGVAAAGVLVATVLSGPDAGADVRTGRISVDYTCRLPDGTQALTASLTQNYPTADTAGAPLQPGPLTIRTTVPAGCCRPRPPRSPARPPWRSPWPNPTVHQKPYVKRPVSSRSS